MPKLNKKQRELISKWTLNIKAVEKCIACNGSGYYDHNGSPKCDSCNGTGIEQ